MYYFKRLKEIIFKLFLKAFLNFLGLIYNTSFTTKKVTTVTAFYFLQQQDLLA